MSEDNFETIKVEAHPCQVGTNCMICDHFIPLGFGYYGSYTPITRICDECKKRLMKILYEDVEEMVRCKDCRHRDPEDHKCDCGQLERAGCVFPVDDDYFCAYGERRGET